MTTVCVGAATSLDAGVTTALTTIGFAAGLVVWAVGVGIVSVELAGAAVAFVTIGGCAGAVVTGIGTGTVLATRVARVTMGVLLSFSCLLLFSELVVGGRL